MPLYADSPAVDALGVAVKALEGLAAVMVALAGGWYVVQSRRRDIRERDIRIGREQYEADHERDEDERKAKREERDHVIEELRGLIEEAKAEAREAKREMRKGQEATARKMAEIQSAHHDCEKSMAGQAVQISHLTEINKVNRAELEAARDRLVAAERRIKELEDRSDNGHAPAPEGDRR